MIPQIVRLSVSQTAAPAPNTLQGTVFLISQGGTNTAASALSLLTQPADFTPLMAASITIASATWSLGTATFTTVAPHGIPVEAVEPVALVVSGMSPLGYNGAFAATITGASTFTVPIVANPGTASVFGVVVPENSIELNAMVTSFFGMGTGAACYVLELGEGDPAAGVAALTAYMVANPTSNPVSAAVPPTAAYVTVVPFEWDGESTFLNLIAAYQSLTAKTYFAVTTTTTTYTRYTALMKNVVAFVQAPTALSTEWAAADFAALVSAAAPSATHKALPYAYSFLYGVTPYPQKNNAALLQTLLNASVNFVATGAEGGITTAILASGTTMDGNDFLYWYAADWMQINQDLNAANAIINGSNNPLAPLDYDQPGVNQLAAVATQTAGIGVTFGLVNKSAAVIVTATPFAAYVTQNPGNYNKGTYNGIGVQFTPARGFKQLGISININQFPSVA